MTQAGQARFVQRVARAFEVAQGRGGELRLRLSPPELGSLRLEIKVQSGLLAARLEVESPQARTLLMDNLSVLRERLAEQGIRVEQFDVELMDRHSGQLPPDSRQQNGSATPDQELEPTGRESTERTEPESPLTRGTSDGGLNVVV